MTVALYARVSSEEQRQRQSIETQHDFGRRFSSLHDHPIYKIYSDDGVSEAVPFGKRSGASQLLDDARKGKFDTLLVYKVDRLARTTLAILSIIADLEGIGVAVRSMTEPFDTSTSVGKFVLTLLASFAQLEKDTLKERSGAGMERTARQGKWNGGKPPLGYRTGEDGKLEIDPAQAKLVKQIFKHYLAGKRTVWIADHLTARGVPVPLHWRQPTRKVSGRWSPGVVSSILNNRTYIGDYTWRERRAVRSEGRIIGWNTATEADQISFNVPSIISRKDFERVQKLLKENLALASRNMKRFYPLRGLVICGICGRKYVGAGHHKEQLFYYRCFSQCTTGIKNCGNKAVRAEDLESEIWNQVLLLIRRRKQVFSGLAQRLRAQRSDRVTLEKEQARILQAIAEKQKERARVINLNRRGLISDRETERELEQHQSEVAQLESERDELFNRQAAAVAHEARLIGAESLLEQLAPVVKQATPEEKGAIFRQIIDRLTLKTVDGELQVEVQFFENLFNSSLFGCPTLEQIGRFPAFAGSRTGFQGVVVE